MHLGVTTRTSVCLLGLLCALVAPPSAGAQESHSTHVNARIAPSLAVRASKSSQWAGTLTLTMAPGWHIYGVEPGTSGLPTTLRWRLADGWTLRTVSWPTPVRQVRGRDTTFEYEGSVAVHVALEANAIGRPAAMHQLTITLGVCREICIPERLTLRFSARRR